MIVCYLTYLSNENHRNIYSQKKIDIHQNVLLTNIDSDNDQ